MIDENRRQLFTHPATMILTHVVFPLLNLGGVAYIFWITKEALDPTLYAKGVATLCAAGAIPLLGAVASAIAFKRRPGLWQMFAFSMIAAAFLYFGFPVAGAMESKVDSWIVSATPTLAMMSGIMPMIFAGVAAVALEKLSKSKGLDIGVSGGLLLAGPLCFFMVVEFATTIERALRGSNSVLQAVLGHVIAVSLLALTFLFFVGLLRGLFQLTRLMGQRSGRTAGVMVCALVLPFLGLALNLAIPFPADFANPWPWALSAYTALVLLPKPRSDGAGLFLYFLQSAAGPFVLYFFLLFVPFLPLAIPAIIVFGTGFLILSPTILFRFYTREMYGYWLKLRETYPASKVIAVAVAGFLVLPALFVADVEIERRNFKALLEWHTEEDYDEPAKPMPCSQVLAEKIMSNVNDFAFGAEIPFLSSWRSFRVYDGMYLADNLRNELNVRVLGKKYGEDDWERNWRNAFGAEMFGANPGRRNARGGSSLWRIVRPERTMDFDASAEPSGDALYTVKVAAAPASGNNELILKFKLPAGAWIEGMRLKLADGTWKQARASERKAAEWVYRKITEQRLDPSIVTLDTPTEGTFKIFPVGEKGREAELAIRLPSKSATPNVVSFAAVPPPPKTKRKMGKDGKWKYETEPKKELVWKDVANPDYSASPEIYRAAGAAVSVVGADWMEAHLDALKKLKTAGAEDGIAVRVREFDGNDRELWSKLRREVRAAAREFAEKGEFSDFGFKNDTIDAAYEKVDDAKMAILRREFPGQAGFKDSPVEGWFFLPKVGGGKAAVPYRKGQGAVVFAALEGAVEIGGKWAEGAKAWELENKAFLKPALDVRAELLKATRESGALTTKSAYIAVETTAQEKGLRQKEAEALFGNQNLEFEEPESSDAPGMLLMLAFVAIFFALRKRLRSLLGGRLA